MIEETRSATLIAMLDKGKVHTEDSREDLSSGVQHKLCFDAHPGGSKLDVLRYHITTRNFFAFLIRKALVGFTFYQALVDLHKRLEEYLSPGIDKAVALQSYLVMTGLLNVSNEPRAAAGLLAWSEDVRWNNGWREAYAYLCFILLCSNSPIPKIGVTITALDFIALPQLVRGKRPVGGFLETAVSY